MRGIDREEIRAAVDKLSPETEAATARALVDRKLASTVGQLAPVRIRRLTGMLARKGYPAGLAYRVVQEALRQSGQDAVNESLDDEVFKADCEEQ